MNLFVQLFYQLSLFKPLLGDIVSPRHAMVQLADAIDWQSFEDGLGASFCVENGRPSCPVRLMVALHYLKYASGILLTDYDGLLSVCCDNAQEPWPINLLGHCETSDEKYSNKAYSEGQQWMSLSK